MRVEEERSQARERSGGPGGHESVVKAQRDRARKEKREVETSNKKRDFKMGKGTDRSDTSLSFD